MRVFITGATGWIGSATTRRLLAEGHRVEGLARSADAETALREMGAHVRRGSLDDLDAVRDGADSADAVVHLANKHDFTDLEGTSKAEYSAVDILCRTLSGSERPLVLASVLTGIATGRPATELDASPFRGIASLRGGSENLALDYAQQGVRAIPVRFPPTVHGPSDPGLMSNLAGITREKGISGYVGDGDNQWAAVHVEDAAELVVAAIHRAPGGTVLHAVAEAGVPTRDIAAAIGAGLSAPTASIPAARASEHFGWLGMFFGADIRAESERTRQLLDWQPSGSSLLADLGSGTYFRR
jgi:nucleoside-diphosphate-sugar epimerase